MTQSRLVCVTSSERESVQNSCCNVARSTSIAHCKGLSYILLSQEVERSDSNSSGQKDGLQWSEIDGPTMDNLEDADTGNRVSLNLGNHSVQVHLEGRIIVTFAGPVLVAATQS